MNSPPNNINILFVPRNGIKPTDEEVEHFKNVARTMNNAFARFFYLSRDYAPGISAYHGSDLEDSTPFLEISNINPGGKDLTPDTFLDLINDCDLTMVYFLEPDVSLLKLLPLLKHYRKSVAIADFRTLFEACSLCDINQARLRSNAYALADWLLVPEMAVPTWTCAGLTNARVMPQDSDGWQTIFTSDLSQQRAGNPLVRILVCDRAYDVWEKELPYLQRVKEVPVEVVREVVREVDLTEPWQKALANIVNKTLPKGSYRRKIVGSVTRKVWRCGKSVNRILGKPVR